MDWVLVVADPCHNEVIVRWRRLATAALLFLLFVPLGWSLYAERELGKEYTSSHLIRDFFDSRSPITLVMATWIVCRLASAACPDVGWRADALVWGGVLLGHLFWSR